MAHRVYVQETITEVEIKSWFGDGDPMADADAELPLAARIGSGFGYSSGDLPLSFDEAVEILTKTIEGTEGYVHLHIHEHTHKEISDVVNSYNHHRNGKR
ncbi:hypothetical protein [uncultured Methanolobus sp.]|uniref:hypothetical protein n=1 Tax=uncultured Methanolobus sp. TaxID=218300 RepID=UPI002AAC099E|nr:hypothetical protein [uncultured Methanolobus sp.]